MKSRRTTKVAAAFAALALTVAACGGDSSSDAPAPSTPAAPSASVDALKLGYLLPETGQLAFLGPPMISGVQMAVEEINAAGGLFGNPIELLSADEAGDAGRAAEEGNRLLAAGVQAIVGAASTGMTLSVIDAITSAGVVQCSPSNTGIGLTTYPDKGFYFRTAPSDVLQAPVLAEVILDSGAQNVAVVARADDYGRPFMLETVANIESRGGTVTLEEAYDPDSATFDSIVEAMLASGADAYAIISFVEGAQIVSGLLAAGVLPTQIFGADGIAGAAFADNFASPAVLEGMTFTAPTALVPPAFEERLLAFNPSLVDFLFAPNSYDCVNLIALAAVQGGSTDSQVIRDNMIAVSQGDNACTTFAECLPFLENGQTIAYQSSAGGALNLIEVREGGGEPSVGTIEISKWVGGEFVSQGLVTGNLLG
jgi:branched-chain amino acid transport system substrate-binding protein